MIKRLNKLQNIQSMVKTVSSFSPIKNNEWFSFAAIKSCESYFIYSLYHPIFAVFLLVTDNNLLMCGGKFTIEWTLIQWNMCIDWTRVGTCDDWMFFKFVQKGFCRRSSVGFDNYAKSLWLSVVRFGYFYHLASIDMPIPSQREHHHSFLSQYVLDHVDTAPLHCMAHLKALRRTHFSHSRNFSASVQQQQCSSKQRCLFGLLAAFSPLYLAHSHHHGIPLPAYLSNNWNIGRFSCICGVPQWIHCCWKMNCLHFWLTRALELLRRSEMGERKVKGIGFRIDFNLNTVKFSCFKSQSSGKGGNLSSVLSLSQIFQDSPGAISPQSRTIIF